MKIISGKKIIEFSEKELFEIAKNFKNIILDVGAGDGKNTLKLAKSNPLSLVIGLDAAKDNFQKTSEKSIFGRNKQKQNNLFFIWSSIENFELKEPFFDEIIINMPWGNLQRGVLGDEINILKSITKISKKNSKFLIKINLHPWELNVKEIEGIDKPSENWIENYLKKYYLQNGLKIAEYSFKKISTEAISKESSWAKRVASTKTDFKVLNIVGLINPN